MEPTSALLLDWELEIILELLDSLSLLETLVNKLSTYPLLRIKNFYSSIIDYTLY